MADPTRPHQDSGITVRQEGGNIKQWVFGTLIALVLIIALQNSQSVAVNILFINTEMPLIVALLGAAVIGAAIGYIAPIMRRHRRDQKRQERREDEE